MIYCRADAEYSAIPQQQTGSCSTDRMYQIDERAVRKHFTDGLDNPRGIYRNLGSFQLTTTEVAPETESALIEVHAIVLTHPTTLKQATADTVDCSTV